MPGPPGLRPFWLLPAPEPLAEIGAAPHRGGPLKLLAGPERIESGWWDGSDVARDYFVARTRRRRSGVGVSRAQRAGRLVPARAVRVMLPAYAELHCLTNFSFLRGASHPEELVERAAALGYAALAITDECSVAGVVRAHIAAKEYGAQADRRHRGAARGRPEARAARHRTAPATAPVPS